MAGVVANAGEASRRSEADHRRAAFRIAKSAGERSAGGEPDLDGASFRSDNGADLVPVHRGDRLPILRRMRDRARGRYILASMERQYRGDTLTEFLRDMVRKNSGLSCAAV